MAAGRLPPERMYPAGVPGVAVRYVTVAGLAIRVLESGPATGDAVMLVHGWGACAYSYAELIPLLTGAGHRVLAPDLPGFGLSEKPPDESHYTTEALADLLLEVARAMGAPRFSLVAHSMSGAPALRLGMRAPRELRALVLINAVGLGRVPAMGPLKLFSPRFMNAVAQRMLTRGFIRFLLRLAFSTPERPYERDVDEYWAPTQFGNFALACRACIHRGTWRRVRALGLRGLRLPVLVIAGGRDRLVRGSASRARLIPGAKVVNVPEGGHLVMQECATRTCEEVLRFLGGVAPRRP